MPGNEVWLIADRQRGSLHPATLEALAEANSLAEKLRSRVIAIVLGHEIEHVSAQLVHYGAAEILLAEHSLLEEYTTDAYAHVLVPILRREKPRVVILGGTPNGQDLAPSLAARLGAPLASGCIRVNLTGGRQIQAIKPMYAGQVHATLVPAQERSVIITLQPGARAAEQPDTSRRGRIRRLKPQIDPAVIRTTIVASVRGDPRQTTLGEADIIVAGGRGVGGLDQWAAVDALADALGAVVGGTRIAMDAGWISREQMIGQTGETVRPKLYFAVGISGAPQHIGAAQDSQLIIAINNDAAAPIHKQADLGVVGDLHEILPVLTDKLRKLKSELDRGRTENGTQQDRS